jgi:hypothetical protein
LGAEKQINDLVGMNKISTRMALEEATRRIDKEKGAIP